MPVRNYPGGVLRVIAGTDGDDLIVSGVPFAFHRRFEERIEELNPGAGNFTLTSTPVPAGYVHVLQAASAVDTDSAIPEIRIYLTGPTANPSLVDIMAPAANFSAAWTGNVVLVEGDVVNARFYTVVGGDDLYLDIWGYTIRIA